MNTKESVTMKIDLYNNTHMFLADSRQDSAIRRWCRAKNITFDYIMTHPNIQDIQFLIEFNDEFYMELNTSRRLRGIFDGYWGLVYARRKQISAKGFVKLERVVHECLAIRQQNQHIRYKIKSLRHTGNSHTQNKGHDNEAKGPNSLPSNTCEKENQRGGREVQELLPWE